MLGPLALVAVRQEHHETRHAAPLVLAARDELIDDHLRAVGEVPELCLPNDERPRVGGRVAVLEAEDGRLGEGTVHDLEDVLLAGDGDKLADASKVTVSAEIIAQAKSEKVVVFKKRRRHNYRRKAGHRQQMTLLRITDVGAGAKKAPAKKAAAPKKAETEAKPAAAKKPAAKKAPAKKTAAKKKPAAKKKVAAKKPAAKKKTVAKKAPAKKTAAKKKAAPKKKVAAKKKPAAKKKTAAKKKK